MEERVLRILPQNFVDTFITGGCSNVATFHLIDIMIWYEDTTQTHACRRPGSRARHGDIDRGPVSPVISRLSDLFHRKSSWGHAPSITIYLLGIRFMCCVFNWGKYPLRRCECLNNLVIHLASDASAARSGTAVYNTPCRAVSADLIRLLPSATSFTWNIVTVDVHNLLN